MGALKRQVKDAARKAGFLSGGLLFLLVGAAFLTAAAWFALAVYYPPAQVALIIGAVHVGLGLCLIGFGKSGRSRQDAAADPAAVPPLMDAFIYGMRAGERTHRGSRP